MSFLASNDLFKVSNRNGMVEKVAKYVQRHHNDVNDLALVSLLLT